MERSIRTALLLLTVGFISACSSVNTSGALPQIPNSGAQTQPVAQSMNRAGLRPGPAMQVCGAVAIGFARCHAQIRTDIGGGGPSGYNPPDLQSAYSLPSSTAGAGQTVAIVDAFDDANAQSDVGFYRNQFGLPVLNSSGGPTFKKVDQNGGTNYPRGDRGWAEEISLDLDMVSAICPKCNILLVEATSNSNANLYTAENYAAAHANTVSNSWGGGEYSTEASDDNTFFNHPGVAITASSGDSGFGAQFPATSRYITTVGGTTLTKSKSGAFSETAWSSAGSGCSAFIAKQSWQTANADAVCSNRAEADVSAVADPNTGVSVYDTFHQTGWLVFGGTSVSSPIIASVYALAGNASSVTYGQYPYLHDTSSTLHDVTSGSNGSCGNVLCNAVGGSGTAGWDGPTGLGTPNGTGAF